MELTRYLLDRIRELNPQLNAYITVCQEEALQSAQQAEAELCAKTRKSRHDRGPLHGVPISLKDNIYTKGIRTTGGSMILKDFVPLHDAPVVRSLKKAGAVILGKTNMHEFAYGVTTENPHFGTTRNPWDPERIAGGSSGGSAAAVAAGLCYGSIGTDTGGSIRIPASLCGVVGLMPGLGRVRAEDVIPLSPTLDFVGPLARSVRDAALLLEPIFVGDKAERKRLTRTTPTSRARPALLGMPKEFFGDIVEPEVRAAVVRGIETLEKRGARVKEVSLPQLRETEDAGNQIAWAEATLYHEQAGWFPAHVREYGEDVRTRLEMGTTVTAVNYLKVAFRERFQEQWLEAFSVNELDALVVPTTPITAPRIGEDSVLITGSSHATRALLLRLNRPANLAGVPAITLPCGSTKNGLPIGLQFIASWTEEPLLLDIARTFEQDCHFSARPKFESLP